MFPRIQGPPCATRPPQHARGWGLTVSGGPEELTSEMASAAGDEARCFDVLVKRRPRRDTGA